MIRFWLFVTSKVLVVSTIFIWKVLVSLHNTPRITNDEQRWNDYLLLRCFSLLFEVYAAQNYSIFIICLTVHHFQMNQEDPVVFLLTSIDIQNNFHQNKSPPLPPYSKWLFPAHFFGTRDSDLLCSTVEDRLKPSIRSRWVNTPG